MFEAGPHQSGHALRAFWCEERLEIGTAVEIIPPHCYQTVIMYLYYHCVRGDTLVDIWPLDARSSA